MSKTDDLILEVAAKAIIVNQEGKILILREAPTYGDGTNVGRYHVPGGRINPKETFEEGLRREVEEETGLTDITLVHPVYVGDWWPKIKGVTHHIVGTFMLCRTKTSKIQLSSEHDDYKWILPDERKKYDVMDPEWAMIDTYVKQIAANN